MKRTFQTPSTYSQWPISAKQLWEKNGLTILCSPGLILYLVATAIASISVILCNTHAHTERQKYKVFQAFLYNIILCLKPLTSLNIKSLKQVQLLKQPSAAFGLSIEMIMSTSQFSHSFSIAVLRCFLHLLKFESFQHGNLCFQIRKLKFIQICFPLCSFWGMFLGREERESRMVTIRTVVVYQPRD